LTEHFGYKLLHIASRQAFSDEQPLCERHIPSEGGWVVILANLGQTSFSTLPAIKLFQMLSSINMRGTFLQGKEVINRLFSSSPPRQEIRADMFIYPVLTVFSEIGFFLKVLSSLNTSPKDSLLKKLSFFSSSFLRLSFLS
jgi:hypothetical protein